VTTPAICRRHHRRLDDQGLVIAEEIGDGTLLSVGTFSELMEQAEQEIRAHIRSTSSDSTHHFVVDSTNYFVDHGAGLVAALRVWAERWRKTDADLRALIDLADAVTLENIAEKLAHSHDPDGLHASVQLEAIAFAVPPQLYATLDFARKGLQRS
jgi:hypothetical protein